MKALLLEAAMEIERLRRQNEIMGAQLEVVEIFRAALLGPRTPQGMAVDVAWKLRQAVDGKEVS